jgi:inorganic triphosphatase YgiF
LGVLNDDAIMSTTTTEGPAKADDDSELELKLEIDADRMDALGGSDVVAGIMPTTIHQVATYYDTPTQDLRIAGISLRVRADGARHVQTIKAGDGGDAGFFARSEWEIDVSGMALELDVDSPLRTLVPASVLQRLRPAFTVAVTRRQWLIEQDGATIELVADTGSVSAGERSAPVSELELELKAGSASAIFALARRLGDAVPLRLGVLTKGERGYRLIDRAILGAVKAERLELDEDVTVADAFARIVGSCLRHFRLNEALLRAAPDVEALHQTRVALRRLRSAMSIFKPVVADARFAHLAGELKWLAGTLGLARDLDVLIERLGDDAPEQVADARADAYVVARDALDSQRTRELMIDLIEWTVQGAWRRHPADADQVLQPAVRFAGTVLGALRRRIKRRGADLMQLDDEARHQVRITAKKLRYATGFFDSLYTGKRTRRRFKAFTRKLEALQDHLGALNDLATAPALLARFGLDNDAAAPAVPRDTILADASEAHEDLIDSKRFW